EPVDDRRLLTPERQEVRLPGDTDTAEVADVLADRQGTVDEVVRHLPRRERVELLDEGCGALLEPRPILLSPPVREAPVAVVLRTLIVEAVPDLVPDDRTDPAVVRRRIPVLVEE